MISANVESLTNGTLYAFRDWPIKEIPAVAAGVYSIWSSDENLIYVGMSGRGLSANHLANAANANETKGLWNRLNSHASGMRSGDQFCVYVADWLVLPTLTEAQILGIANRTIRFDHLVRDFIRTELHFRFTTTNDGESAAKLENECRSGLLGQLPLLNPRRLS